MDKNVIKIIALSAVFALSAGISLNLNLDSKSVYAEQHFDNYQQYKYSGSYYSSLANTSYTEGLNGTLRKKLSSLILPKGWYAYSGSSSGCLGYELQQADEDPTNSSNMVLFYTRDSVSKRAAGGSTTDWNREHVWPQSLSNNHWGKDKAGADVLHIRPTWYTTNNTRGNTVYGDINKSNPIKYNNMVYAYTSSSRFEPIDAVKGDVARILMYVWTAYYEYYDDASLYLTKAIESYDTLLKWHTLDKPDALEGHRNDYSESSKQKNRNPFVDHPEYAWQIFGNSASASVKSACEAAYPDSTVNPPTSSSSSSSSSSIESSSSIISSSESSSSISSSESSSSSLESSSSISSSESSSSESSSESSSSSVASSSSSSSEISYSGQEPSSSINSSSESSSSESAISSSEEPSSISSEISSEQPSSEIISSSSNNEPSEPKKSAGGCHGSLIGTVSLAGLTALFGLVFILSKKK